MKANSYVNKVDKYSTTKHKQKVTISLVTNSYDIHIDKNKWILLNKNEYFYCDFKKLQG